VKAPIGRIKSRMLKNGVGEGVPSIKKMLTEHKSQNCGKWTSQSQTSKDTKGGGGPAHCYGGAAGIKGKRDVAHFKKREKSSGGLESSPRN